VLAFEWIIGLLLGAMALSALARYLRVPYPTFLALGGIGLAFLPGVPEWKLEPDLALALLVAPVLLDAAFDTSLRDLRANWLSVSTLVLVAVALTTAAVAALAHWLVPAMPWAAAIALGAIVAPPDAGAATAILRGVRLPYRLLKILEGESLLNDASALLIYRVAVGAALASSLSFSSVAPVLAIALIGSPIAGFVLAKLSTRLTSGIDDIPTMIIVQFASCFLVWIIAEKLGLSPIVTIVVFAMAIARSTPASTPARKRIPAYAVWETMVFLLNVGAFVIIGMQLRPIWSGLDAGVGWRYCGIAAAVLAVVILTRFAWVMSFNAVMRAKSTKHRRDASSYSAKAGILASWCGMRGIVTLAAAFALPDGFPQRDLILLTAFGVVLGTLVLQGLTLRPLILYLALDDGDPLAREIELARGSIYRAALVSIEGDTTREAKILRLEYEQMLVVEQSERLASGELPADPLRRQAIRAARTALVAMRSSGEIGDDAFHRLEEELDWAELNAGAATT
jgi:CPA1 family monovalent cation:H+ antiporter